MLRKLYDWTLRQAARPNALGALGVVSFAESSFFPVPPDVLLIPMVLAQRQRAWVIAAVCTVASVLGGLFGYAIGFYLFETVGRWLIKLYGLDDRAAQFRAFYDQWGLWVILIKGLTPIPFKIITIMSGAAHFDLATFFLASAATRGTRFFLVAALLKRFGPPIREFIEKRLTLVFLAFLAALVGGFIAMAYL
ncbi:MAG: DedA family protein [Rhodospirillaceae bacterium]|nr:DedA family protein [Rhodospirillaceae bacterium]